jgi:hypothetical protein
MPALAKAISEIMGEFSGKVADSAIPKVMWGE